MFKGKGILAWLVTAGALLQSCGPVNAPLTVEERKSEMNWLITQIEANYAPLQYKQELLKFKWEDRKQEFLKRSEKEMTNDEYTLLAGDLLNSFKDAHTGLVSMNTLTPDTLMVTYLGVAGMRLTEKGKDLFYVRFLLPTYQKSSSYPLKKGDRISKANGQDIATYMGSLCTRDPGTAEAKKTVAISDFAIFASNRCKRPAELNVTLTVLRDDKELTVELPWVSKDYYSFVKQQSDAIRDSSQNKPRDRNQASNEKFGERMNLDSYAKLIRTQMDTTSANNIHDLFKHLDLTSEILMAPVENALVKSEETKVEAKPDFFTVPNNSFDVRFYNTEKGAVGYIQVRSFVQGKTEDFAKALSDLKLASVKSLVLNLVNNGGGSLTYGITLANMFKKPGTAEQSIAVRLNDNWLNGFRLNAVMSENDSIAELNQRMFNGLRAALTSGKTLSEPMLYSQALIGEKPSSTAVFNLPVTILVNEMCASMCDIFSADLKDSGIAKIFGKNTMGAGGNVVPHGISPRMNLLVTLTESLIKRANGTYIENVGVAPDTFYEPTANDLDNGYSDFIKEGIKAAL